MICRGGHPGGKPRKKRKDVSGAGKAGGSGDPEAQEHLLQHTQHGTPSLKSFDDELHE